MRRGWFLLIGVVLGAAAFGQTGGRESMPIWPRAERQSGFLFPIAPEDYLAWTSPYGLRVSPLLRVLTHHDGIDVQAVPGAQVVAAADGWVHELWPPPDGYFRGHPVYGGLIVIAHSTEIETLYAHLSAVFVRGWEPIRRGQVIGRIGRTGKATDPHLHFEIRLQGKPMNPLLYMKLPRNE